MKLCHTHVLFFFLSIMTGNVKSQRTLRCPHSTEMASSETPPPPSPGTGGAVPLAPALLGLLRFVLSSHLAAPDPALPLSPSYCSRLLLDDDDDDLLEKLAAGLARCVEEGRLPVAAAAAEAGIPAGEAWSEEREREWEAVVLEKGNELKMVKLHLCLLLIWLPFMAYFVDNMK